MTATEYFGNIRDTVTTIFEGMSITFSHLVRKPYTVQYPDRIATRVQDTLPFRYRGRLKVETRICTGCQACQRACPIDCIVIDASKDPQTKETKVARFDIDLAKCMYCGLCSEPCNTGAIQHTQEFEGADYELKSLVARFVVEEPFTAYKMKKEGESDPIVRNLLERGEKYKGEFAKPPAPVKKPKGAPE